LAKAATHVSSAAIQNFTVFDFATASRAGSSLRNAVCDLGTDESALKSTKYRTPDLGALPIGSGLTAIIPDHLSPAGSSIDAQGV